MLHEEVAMKYTAFLLIVTAGLLPADPLAAQFKPEFKMSIVASEDTSWGRAANRFTAAIKYRTQGRIQITNYFGGRAFAGAQTTEFQLLQEGVVDFAIGSTINWSPQVKELNLFALPFLFPSYSALDAVEAGDPGKRLFIGHELPPTFVSGCAIKRQKHQSASNAANREQAMAGFKRGGAHRTCPLWGVKHT
jgi:TRAP-type C4-dicarboxylate transport system substrate-binding protein